MYILLIYYTSKNMGTRIKKIRLSKVWLNYEQYDDFDFERSEELFFKMRDEMTSLIKEQLRGLRIELRDRAIRLIHEQLSDSQNIDNWNENFRELELWARDNKIEIEIV